MCIRANQASLADKDILARPVAATKSETRNPKSETNPNHRNSKFKTNHNVLFGWWLWQPDSNIKHKKQEVEGL